MEKKSNIENLSRLQRRLRYALCVDIDIFLEEHNGEVSQEEFLKAFNADSEWNEEYKAWAKETNENLEEVLKEEIFPKYCKEGSNILKLCLLI